MKILITGGKGFLGSTFYRLFSSKYSILALGSKDLDVTDENRVYQALAEFKPDVLIHMAAKAETKFCEENAALAHRINVNGAIYAARACKKIGARMIFTSTEQIFNGNKEDGPYNENHSPLPNTVYGQNKLEAEIKVKEILNDLWILRFTWIFGLPEHGIKLPGEILFSTVKSLMEGREIGVSENEYRGMSYAYEIAENLEKVFSLPYGTYHFGSHNRRERYEIVKFIVTRLAGEKTAEKLVKKKPNPYGSKRDIRLDCGKISTLGVNFMPSEEALLRCLSDFGYIKGES